MQYSCSGHHHWATNQLEPWEPQIKFSGSAFPKYSGHKKIQKKSTLKASTAPKAPPTPILKTPSSARDPVIKKTQTMKC